MSNVDDDNENLALAFGLTLGAGLATTIGAMVPFFSSVQNIGILAGGLGVSSGVMLYVSFVEIYTKSLNAFIAEFTDPSKEENPGADRDAAWAATGCFFAGILVTVLLDILVHKLEGGDHNHDITEVLEAVQKREITAREGARIAAALEEGEAGENTKNVDTNVNVADQFGRIMAHAVSEPVENVDGGEMVLETDKIVPSEATGKENDAALKRMGLITALAIGIHNLPEGLATFVATLADESLGVALAIAIAIHNVPEGICVAVPVYYATGSRVKAFWWSFLSGVSEPFGALLGYLILREVFDDMVYGVLFGIVGGMMVWIVLKELLPMGLKYDNISRKNDHHAVFFPSLVVGMAIMAFSLLLFL